MCLRHTLLEAYFTCQEYQFCCIMPSFFVHVVEFCVRTPLPEKINGRKCRYFFKCKLETTFNGQRWCTPSPFTKKSWWWRSLDLLSVPIETKTFLHLELQNKAHKLFGTISSWAQSCAAKNSLAFQKVVLVSLSAGWTEGKNMSKQIRQL